MIPREVERNGFLWQPIEFAHTATVARLPFHHNDPFDRLLIAQSQVEGMPIVSIDRAFDPYGITRVW